jgi:hypothetical protein
MDGDDDGLQQQTDIQPEAKKDASMKEESDGEDQQDDWTLDVPDAIDTKVSVPEWVFGSVPRESAILE